MNKINNKTACSQISISNFYNITPSAQSSRNSPSSSITYACTPSTHSARSRIKNRSICINLIPATRTLAPTSTSQLSRSRQAVFIKLPADTWISQAKPADASSTTVSSRPQSPLNLCASCTSKDISWPVLSVHSLVCFPTHLREPSKFSSTCHSPLAQF